MGEAGLPWHPPEGSPLIRLLALAGHVRPGISQAEEGLTPLRVSWSFSQERAFLLRGAFLDMEVIYLAGEKIHLQRESYKRTLSQMVGTIPAGLLIKTSCLSQAVWLTVLRGLVCDGG